jgi:acyl-CoA thioester hydrolase
MGRLQRPHERVLLSARVRRQQRRFFRYFGIDDDYRAHEYSIYSLETHLRHVREAALGEPLRLTLRLLDCDHKRLHLFHRMYRASDEALLATAGQLLIHVDMQAARAAPFPADLQRRLASIRFAHAQALLFHADRRSDIAVDSVRIIC